MPQTWNAAVAWRNYADRGSVSASSFFGLLTPARLQNEHVARKWGATGNDEYVTIDLGAPMLIDTFAMLGLNLTAAGVTRVRASLADSSGLDGSAYDSGEETGLVDPRFGALVKLALLPVLARYVRIDLRDATLDVVRGGRVVVSLRHRFEINFAYGWGRSRIPLSRLTPSRGGQTHIDKGPTKRRVDLTFEWLSEAEREVVEDIDRENDISTDMLFIVKSDSDNLGRDAIWGLAEGLSAVTQPTAATQNGGGFYAKSFSIVERL